jgi:hypothetical protein
VVYLVVTRHSDFHMNSLLRVMHSSQVLRSISHNKVHLHELLSLRQFGFDPQLGLIGLLVDRVTWKRSEGGAQSFGDASFIGTKEFQPACVSFWSTKSNEEELAFGACGALGDISLRLLSCGKGNGRGARSI